MKLIIPTEIVYLPPFSCLACAMPCCHANQAATHPPPTPTQIKMFSIVLEETHLRHTVSKHPTRPNGLPEFKTSLK